MKKFYQYFFAVMLIFMSGAIIHASNAYAADLAFTNSSLADGTAHDAYYDKLDATGGSGKYTFSYVGGLYPQGLVFGDDGTISGTPLSSGGFSNLRMRVTDKETGESVIKRFRLRINPVYVSVSITDTMYTYEIGKTYKATVTTDPEVNATVTYGGLSEVSSAGSYSIKVKLPSGYTTDYANDRSLTVSQSDDSSISVTGGSYPYDGKAHPASAAVSPEGLSYEILYRKQGETEYSSEEPVEIGSYSVLARTTNSNYTTRQATSIIRITNEIVNFEISDRSKSFTGNPLAPAITPSKNIKYSVQYRNVLTGEVTDEVSEVGTYKVLITSDEEDYDVNITTDDTFVITETMVDVTVSAENETISYGDKFSLSTETNPECDKSHIVITLVNKETSERYSAGDTLPAGEYSIDVSFDYENGEMAVGSVTAPELTVSPKEVSFTPSKTELDYTGKPQTVTFTPSSNLLTDSDYSVKYVLNETEYNSMTNPGSYKADITISNGNFVLAEGEDIVITVNGIVVDVTVSAEKETISYGDKFSLSTETSPECDESHIVITLVNKETSESYSAGDTLPAGEYSVAVSFDYENGEMTVGNVTAPELKVDPKEVSFTPSKTSLSYTGQPQTVTFTPSSNLLTDSDYSVKYVLNETSYSAMTATGSYTADITIISGNFVPAGGDITITVTPAFSLKAGNSPMAMIEKDSSKTDEWKAGAKEFFMKNHYFNDDYLPQNCRTGILYSSIGQTNYDIDPSTVIVQKWSDFEDPGMTVTDETGTRTVYGKTSVTPAENTSAVYDVVYTDSSVELTRHVIVLGADFGDANRDGIINAIDANELRKRIKTGNITPDNVFDARICDVTKDGSISEGDAAAIYNRFKTALTPYYPWIVQ